MSDSADERPRNCPMKIPTAIPVATMKGSSVVKREFLYMDCFVRYLLLFGFGLVLERITQPYAQNGLCLHIITLCAVIIELEIDARREVFRGFDIERVFPPHGRMERQYGFFIGFFVFLFAPLGVFLLVEVEIGISVFLPDVGDPAVEGEDGGAVAQDILVSELAVEVDLDR